MKIISIESRDIHVTFELSITQIEKLLLALGHSKIEYDSKEDPEVEKAVEYLKEDFFVKLDKIVDEIHK